MHTKSTHPITELLSTFSTVEEILFHMVKNWGVTVDPQQNGEKINGGWHSELGGRTPQPPLIPTLLCLSGYS